MSAGNLLPPYIIQYAHTGNIRDYNIHYSSTRVILYKVNKVSPKLLNSSMVISVLLGSPAVSAGNLLPPYIIQYAHTGNIHDYNIHYSSTRVILYKVNKVSPKLLNSSMVISVLLGSPAVSAGNLLPPYIIQYAQTGNIRDYNIDYSSTRVILYKVNKVSPKLLNSSMVISVLLGSPAVSAGNLLVLPPNIIQYAQT